MMFFSSFLLLFSFHKAHENVDSSNRRKLQSLIEKEYEGDDGI